MRRIDIIIDGCIGLGFIAVIVLLLSSIKPIHQNRYSNNIQIQWNVNAFVKKVIRSLLTGASPTVKAIKDLESLLESESTANPMNEEDAERILNFAWRNRDLSLKVDSLDRKLTIAVNALKAIQHLCNQSVHPISKDIYSIARQALLPIEEPKKVEPKPIEKMETRETPKRGRPRTTKALF